MSFEVLFGFQNITDPNIINDSHILKEKSLQKDVVFMNMTFVCIKLGIFVDCLAYIVIDLEYL